MKQNRLTIIIFLCMIAGIVLGEFIHVNHLNADGKADVAFYTDKITLLTKIFLNLIKMIISPLVISALIVGISKLDSPKTVGKIGGITLGWFLFATIISLSLGMLLVNFFQPGAGIHVALPDQNLKTNIATNSINPTDFITHIFPTSIFKSLAENELLQIIIFSIFFGIACGAMPEKSKPIIHLLDSMMHIMLRITSYVMYFAPIAVFAAISSTIAQSGFEVMNTLGILIAEFFGGLILLIVFLSFLAYLFIGKKIFHLFVLIKDALILAFGTASSEAAFPKLTEQLERFGCSNKIVSFVLPLGYSFNLDGSMMYMTFASLFIAQCYHIHLSFAEQLSMLLVLMLTSKGIAGVPRASLVVISGALSTFHIPESGLLLLMGIDQILDMGRSATNVVGNAIASAVVNKLNAD
jgi:Na+/H+-dicarboxylate symporter